jgi:chromosome segregation ATPase
MIKMYGLAQNVTHVEQHTLLDTNNHIPSWETGDGEKAEVSIALLKLREEYDEIRRRALEKDEQLVQIKADIKKAREEEKRVSKDFGGATLDIEKSQAELDHLKITHDTQKMEKKGFNYMMSRMKRDLISLNLTINDLTDSLKSKTGFSDEEFLALVKSREQKL